MKHKSLGKQIENFYSLFVIFIHFGPADAKVGAAAIQLFCTDGHRSRDICISLQCKKRQFHFFLVTFPLFIHHFTCYQSIPFLIHFLIIQSS